MLSVQLVCEQCAWQTLCGESEMVRRLRKLWLFRRASDPPEELVREVLHTSGRRLTCDSCGSVGLAVRLDGEGDDAGDWERVVVCEICREPISAERLEFFPSATRCAKCQDAADRGKSFAEPEFCPRCGSLLELRVSLGGGVTRYKQCCTGNPPCRL